MWRSRRHRRRSAQPGHELRRKDVIYAEQGAAVRAYVDPRERHGWWARIDSIDHHAAVVTWQPPDWSAVSLDRSALLAA